MNLAQGIVPVESREEVRGEQRLREPGWASPGRAFESDSRRERFHAFLAQTGGRDVFVLGLRTQAKPGEFLSFLHRCFNTFDFPRESILFPAGRGRNKPIA